jgi:hypothetical protein
LFAQRDSHARQKLACAEGLGKVIIGSSVERGDLILLGFADR